MNDPAVERARGLADAVGPSVSLPEALFAPSFLRSVGADRVAAMLASLFAEHGRVEDVEVVGPLRPGAWVVRWRYGGGGRQLVHVGAESSPPHRLRFLLFGAVWNPGEVDTRPPSRTGVRLPFVGRWHVAWGGRRLAENYHRNSPAQRYAYDFSIVRDGSFCVAEGERNEEHHCFGVNILAPAAGRVVGVVDGIPDNRPGEKLEDEPCGNHVWLRHAEGEYSLMAHLKEGSVRVGEGARVEPLQKIGECGNSGRSSRPHLHFHMQSTPDLADGTGIPPRFHGVRIERDGLEHPAVEDGGPEPRRGDYVENG